MKKKILIGISVVLLVGLIVGGKYGLDYMYYEKTMPTVVISNLAIENVQDGVYFGAFDAKILAAKVKVTVKDGEIVGLDLVKHKHERGKPAEAVLGNVLEEQTLKVDTVSGATESSKTILKAIENALNSNPE